MLSKSKIIKIISIIYWGLIIGSGIINIKNQIFNQEFFNEIETYGIENIKTEHIVIFFALLSFIFIFQILVNMIKNFIFTIFYFASIISIKKFYNSKIDITDKKNNQYFRDTLSKYSPGVLGFIKDFKINENDIAATLLSLELKNKIKIEDKINILNNSYDNLDQNEKYILENLINKTYNNINLLSYETKVLEDCKQNNLLKEIEILKKESVKNRIKFIIFYISLILIFNLGFPIFNKYLANNSDIAIIIFMIVMCIDFILMIISLPIFIISNVMLKSMNYKNPYIRSKKAKELNEKLNGLENFLKDFSNIEQRGKKELIIWEDYLIYSVTLGMNDDISDDILNKLKQN